VNPCVAYFAKQWENLFTILKTMKKEKKQLLINKNENLYFTILKLQEGPSSCRSCCTRYPCFEMYGFITGDYFEDKTKQYECSASISMNEFHSCRGYETSHLRDLNDQRKTFEENIFFRGYVENTNMCVCHYYLDYFSLLESFHS